MRRKGYDGRYIPTKEEWRAGVTDEDIAIQEGVISFLTHVGWFVMIIGVGVLIIYTYG